MSDCGTTRSEAAYAEGSPFRPAEQEPLLNRAIPVSGELGRHRALTAQRDVRAGVTVAALAVPSAMAYGELAANASYVKGRVREAVRGSPPPVNCVLFDMEALTHVDATGLDALRDIVRDLR
jgi:MFS superfamily sulfate permease-like transporter